MTTSSPKEQQDRRQPLYLVDGSAYLYRAYFAIRTPMTTSDGIHTKAVFGVTSMLLKILREKQPEYIAMVWDAKGPTFRHELYSEYKANRPPMPQDLAEQIPLVREVVKALGIAQLELQGYEADDIIAALASKCSDRQVIVVSGDKDLLQLLNGNITIWDLMKEEMVDGAVFRERYGIEPWQWRDVLALAGDSSDNIPGIPGVGLKTALKLIRKYGSIENLLEDIPQLKGKLRERLEAHRDELALWSRLVSLRHDIPVEGNAETLRRRELETEYLEQLFKKLEFNRFLNELLPARKIISMDNYSLARTEEDVTAWVNRIKEAGRVTIDTETTSEVPMEAKLVGVSLCIEPPEAVYIPLAHVTEELQPDMRRTIEQLAPVLSDRSIVKTGQNIKYDMIVMARHGASMEGVEFDTMIASYLLNPSRRRHGLDEIAQDLLGHQMISYKQVTSGLKKGSSFAEVSLDKARDYSCEDVHVTCLAREKLEEMLKDKGLYELFTKIEMPLVPVLVHMEMAGIRVDADQLDRLSDEFSARLRDIESEIYELAGEKFNINSPAQLGRILFEKLQLPHHKKTKKKTGYSTDMEVLKKLAEIHPLPARILVHRNIAKLKSTYVDGLKKAINPQTGRIHTSFNQTVTATGRLSSSNPNLQNIPVKTDEGRRIRQLFVAPEGRIFVSADYSQIDLRVLAHYSRDRALVTAFRNGEDIHGRTASEVFGVMPQLVTPEMRRVAKTVNFGIIYGMSPYGLAKELSISRKEAAEFMERYFNHYPGVKIYIDKIVAEAREKGYVTTLFGRRRYLPDIHARQKNIREFAERTAVNTPIQGTAADIIKLAMIKCRNELQELFPGALMVLQVHDELVIECDVRQREKVAGLVADVMENVTQLEVPLEVSVGYGKNWAEIK